MASSPLNRVIKEHRQRTKRTDGSSYQVGVLADFLRYLIVEEQARILLEDWLSVVIN